MTAPSSPLRQRLRAATTEAMLDAAEAVMIEHGYDKATMQQIAAAAGCATGTLYLYFKNKEVLLEAIMARHSTLMFQAARAAVDSADAPLDKVRAGLRAFLQFAHEHRPLFRLVFTAVPVRHRAMRQKLGPRTRMEREEYDRLELDLLRQSQRDGTIRSDLPAETLQEFMDDVGFGIVEQFAFSAVESSVDEAMRVMWGLITGGIGSRV